MKKNAFTVSIVGRRNVGKSTLFNAIIGKKKSIVDPEPGLTRDMVTFPVLHCEKNFLLADTPGLDLPADSELSKTIIANASESLKKSSVIVFLLENPGLEKFDIELARLLRKLAIPVITAVNKMDNPEDMANMTNFYEYGFTELIPVSAVKKTNISLLLDKISDALPGAGKRIGEPDIKISIVGRPNSGKSTLINAFMGYARSVVSEIPGTTRDSVDGIFRHNNRSIQITDTAGIRKKSRFNTEIEYFSFSRTLDSIINCDVAVHLIDAPAGLTDTDKKISDIIRNNGKPAIIAVNKWDLLDKNSKTFDEFREKTYFSLYATREYPMISISASEKQRIHRILPLAFELKAKAEINCPTPLLNAMIEKLFSPGKMPSAARKIKIYYAVQTGIKPHRFKFFVNRTEYFKKDIIRFFEKALKNEFGLEGLPVFIETEDKQKS